MTPDARAVAEAVSRVVEEAAVALDRVTEAQLADGLEAACVELAAATATLAERLPSLALEPDAKAAAGLERRGPRRAKALEDVGELSKRVQRLADSECLSNAASEDISNADLCAWDEESLKFVMAVRAVLMDISVALDEITRDELEELAEVCLAVARMAVHVARRAASQVTQQADVLEKEHRSSVVITDLTEETEDAPSPSQPSKPGVVRCNGPRRLWLPLRPRLLAWLRQPKLPRCVLVDLAAARPYSCVAVGVATWPLVLAGTVTATVTVCCTFPGVLIVDEVVQRIYASRRMQVDDCIDGLTQVTKLGYLTGRLAFRRGARVAKAQLSVACSEFGPSLKNGMSHPVTTVSAAARFAVRASRAAGSGAAVAWDCLPSRDTWLPAAGAAWHRLRGGLLGR